MTRVTATVMLFVFAAATAFGQAGVPLPNNEAGRADMVGELNFVDFDAQAMLQTVETLSGKPIISAQNLPAVKISFNSNGPMTRQEALIAVESLLSLNGIALTPMGNFIKAVGFQDVARQVPEFLKDDARGYPPSEKFYTGLYKLDYLSVSSNEYQPIIEPIMSPNPIGKIVPLPKANALLLTDTLINLQRVEEVLESADRPQAIREEVLFYPLRNMQARDLQARLQNLLLNQNSAMSKYFANNTTIESDERTNQLIVLTHSSNVKMLNTIIESFDIAVEPQTTSEVFYIKHAQATEIEALLEEVVTGQQQAREDAPTAENAATQQPGQPPGPSPSGSTPPSGSNNLPARPGATPGAAAPRPSVDGVDVENLQFSEFITLVADERSNAIVVYGTKSDIKQIGELIDKIDVVLAQVLIEVLIAEVTLDEDEVSGLASLNLSRDGTSLGGIEFATSTPSAGSATGFSVSAATFDLKNFTVDFGPDIAAGKVRILQAPVIATTHNQEASINVSDSQPFLTGSTTSQINPEATTTTVQYRDVGIQLKVKPLIGSNGIVQMEIEQTVENVIEGLGVEIDGVNQPFIAKREAISFISVTDDEVIVLAGLQESRINRTENSMYFLGKLPILGEIFNSSSDNNTRRELMIFIKPNVIYTQTDATALADRTLDNLDNGDMARQYFENPDMSEIYEVETADPEPKQITRKKKSFSPRRQ